MSFSFFQISNDYCQKPYGKIFLLCNGFRGFLWSSTTSKIFLIYILSQWIDGLLKNFWNFYGNAFCFFIFLNKRSITTSLLIIHVKCTVAHYANLNSKSINKPYLRAVEKAFSFFFDFFFMFILTRLWSKIWKNYHFLIQISKIHFKM